MKFEQSLTFDDVLIKPQYSEIRSRSEIDLSVNLSKGFNFNIPVFPANMKTIVNERVAEEFYKLGAICLLHRFASLEEQLRILTNLREKYKDIFDYVGVSVGVQDSDYKNIKTFYDLGVRIIAIDVAHGDSKNCVDVAKFISESFHDVFLIAGNVATGEGAFRLWMAGADAVKCNVGAGSICTTRVCSGVGVPQLSALIDIYETRQNNTTTLKNKFIIADGGCNKPGDLVKSLALSDMIMTGNMFAGAPETPGEEIKINGKLYKNYDGSSTHKSDYIEGVKSLVEVKPSLKLIVKTMLEGIASGCSYVGAKNINELQKNTVFIRITNAGFRESGAHDVIVK